MPLAQGHRLAHYEILAPIGKGGMGEVFRARDLKLGREVAIKILPASLARDSERLARFEREAKTLASLNHPNVAAIYGIEDSADGPALVMELVPGDTLKTPLPMDAALNYFRQIAEALETAHEKGVVHRDLKPTNIMVTPDGVIKVLDFGLAAVATSAEHPTDPENSPTFTLGATTPGSIIGTAAYMSPEQASGRAVDRRSDIWSFGVVLWETLSGERLFGGETLSHTLADVLRAPIDFGKLPAGTPRAVRELVRRCLDRDVKMRLRDIGEARVAIDRALAEPEAPVVDVARNARSQLGWIVAAVAAVVAAGLGYVAYRHVAEEPPAVARLELLPPENGVIVTSLSPLAVSPNGRRIVFRANVDGKQMLWVRDLDSPPARMLNGTENATAPFWAPDNRQLAFFTTDLKKIDVTGGPATTVVANTPGPRSGAWNRDDVILFSQSGAGPNLFRVSAAGGTPQPVAGVESEYLQWPHFLPDGRHFLYTATNGGKAAIFVGDLESKDRKLLVPVAGNPQYVGSGGRDGYILFVQEGTLMAQPFDAGKRDATGEATPIAEHVLTANGCACGNFGASRNGVLAYVSAGEGIPQQIRWHDRAGKVVGTVGKPVDIGTLRLSPNQKMLATDRLIAQSNDREIYLYDVVRGYAEQRLTVGWSLFPVWSPDSSRIAFVRRGIGVVLKAVDGSGQEEIVLTPKVNQVNPSDARLTMDWTSRDGGFLLAISPGENPLTGNDIWALPLVGPGPRKQVPLRQTEFAEKHPRVSPDGLWLAYQSNESTRNEVYVVGFPGLNGRRQISIQGGSRPVWSRDGREMYFVSEDNKMMAVEIKPGAQFEAGVPKALFDVNLATANSTYDVSEDGRFLIATPAERTGAVHMTVVLNWQSALRNKKGGLFSRP